MEHYLTSPDIHGERVTFLWNNDLWLMDNQSSRPSRLTSGLGIVTNSRFSPDGRFIAFRVERGHDGSSADLYSIRIEDGKLTRLTYLSGNSTSRRMFTDIAGWTPDGELVVSTDALMPFGKMTQLYTISPEGGALSPLGYGPGAHVIFAGDEMIIGRNTMDLPHWKGYKGGTSGVLWKGRKDGEFTKFVDIGHHISSPFELGNRIFFVSDLEGTGNLYSVDLNGEDRRRHTSLDGFHMRNARSDGKSIVFQCGGDIYHMKDADSAPIKMEIELSSAPAFMEARYLDAGENLEELGLDFTGDNVSIVSRGRLFSAPFKNGMVYRCGDSSEHIRMPHHLDGDRLLYVSDREGEDDIYIRDLKTDGTTRITLSLGVVENIALPDAQDMLVASTIRGELYLVRLGKDEKKPVELLDRSEAGIIEEMSWSPDGRHVVYTFPESISSLGGAPSKVLKILDVKDRRIEKITESGSDDFSPFFSRDGNYILFLSHRNLDPVMDSAVFDLSFPVTTVLMAIPVTMEASLKLDNLPDSFIEHTEEGAGPFALGTLIERQRQLPLRPSDYEDLTAGEEEVFMLDYPVEGMMKTYESGKSGRKGKLIKYNLFTQKEETLVENATAYVLSGNGKVAFYQDGEGNIMKLETSEHDSKEHEKLDLERFRLMVRPGEEWKQMFNEAKRLARENFWSREKIEGELSPVFSKYDALVNRVSTRFELSDLIREFQGEFRTSHSYEMGGDLSDVPAYPAGKIGVDVEYRDGKCVVAKVLKANFSNANEKSPAYIGAGTIKEGDIIETINGEAVNGESTLEKALYNRADEIVRIDLMRNGKPVRIYLKTLPDDRQLRYRAWVEANRQYVHEKSKGRIGYIHIPDMGFKGFAEFNRLYPVESHRDALIVDLRYNGGGMVSQLLLEKLARRRIGYDKPRRGDLEPYPSYSVNGPMVALSDENAGSDGDIFTHAFKLMGLGPVVGTRTWGGVVGINPMHALVDGTEVTQPQFAFWFKDVGYSVENYGTDPTIEVQNSPADWHKGVDAQLERALEVTGDLIGKYEGRVDFKE